MPRKVDPAAELSFVKEKELDGEPINIDTLTEEDEPEEQDGYHHGVVTARLSPPSTPSLPEEVSRRRSVTKRKLKGRQPAAAANFGEQHWKDLNVALLQISLENMHRLYELAPSLDPWRPKGRLNEKVRQFYRHARGATSGQFPSFPHVEHDVQPNLPLPRSPNQPSPQKKDTDGRKPHSASSSSRRSSSASMSSPLPPSPSSPTSPHFLFTPPSSLYSNSYNGRSNLLASPSPSTPTNARPILCQPGARTRRLMEIPLLASPSWPPPSYRSPTSTSCPTTYTNNNNHNKNYFTTTTTSTTATNASKALDTPRTTLLPLAHSSARLPGSAHSEDVATSSYTYSHSAHSARRIVVPSAGGRDVGEMPRHLHKSAR